MKYLSSILFFLFYTLSIISQGQAKISFINHSDFSEEGLERKIEFPIVNIGNNVINSLLNKNIRQDILFDTLKTPIDSALSNMVSGATSFWLVTKVTFNNQNVISILVTCEFCGGSCNDYQEAFVYSLKSGNRLFISDILDSNSFHNEIVRNDVKKSYEESINSIIKLKDSCKNCDESEIDNFDFYIAKIIQQKDEFSISSFCLYEDSIKIINECPFERIESNMCPEGQFIYNYTNLVKYLKIKF